jgi:radical SAM protein with 4Fe4S-binding SPASM domain
LVMQGIGNLLEARKNETEIEIMMTVTRENASSIRPMVDFCKNNRINLWLDPAEINPDVERVQHFDLTAMSTAELEILRQDFNYWAEQMGNHALQSYSEACIQIISGQKPENISCEMGTEHFVLDVDGSMYPCFSRKDINYGNVYEEGINTVMDNPLIKEKQPELQAAKCVSLGCVCMTIVSDYQPGNQSQTN